MKQASPLTALLALTFLAGCSQPQEPLAEVAAWAAQRLSAPDDAVAPRSAAEQRLDSDDSGVVSLLDRLGDAVIVSDWVPADREASAPLYDSAAAAGQSSKRVPYRRRRPGGVEFRGERFSGFTLAGAEIGAIELRGDFGAARQVILSWSRAGSITIPIAPRTGVRTLRVPTDGLSDWNGPRNAIAVAVPAAAARALHIESLRLLPRAQAYAKPVARQRVQLRDQLRDALYAHVPATITWRGLPAIGGKRISFAAGLAEAAAVELAVDVTSPGGEQSILTAKLDEGQRWSDLSAEIPGTASGEIRLRVDGPPGTVVAIAAPTVFTPKQTPRRVLLYLIDTFGARHAHLYGYQRATTPQLEKLAAEGMWFANAFANGSRTVESVATLMSGLPARTHGVTHSFARVDPGVRLLAERFAAAGFATMAFSTNVNAGPRQGLERGFDLLVDRMGFFWRDDNRRTVDVPAIMAWLAQHRDRDVFLYVHTAEPHAPYAAPPPFSSFFDPGYSGSINGRQTDEANGFPHAKTSADIAHVVALYDEEVRYADHQLGTLIDALRGADLLENTVVAVTADHGEEFLEHGRWTHGTHLYGEVTRIPLVIRGHRRATGGRRAAPAQLMDLGATLLDLAGLPPPAGDGSRSLLSGEREAIVASTYQPKTPHHSLLRWPWRLMFVPERKAAMPFQLFQVERDPAESKDELEAEPKVARAMMRELVQRVESAPSAHAQAKVEIDPAQLEQLRALGYEH